MTGTDPKQDAPAQLPAWQKLAVEMGPLIVFFVANGQGGIFVATGAFMAAMAAAMVYSWVRTRHISRMMIFSFVLVMVFGSLTLYLQDETFIKIKPTLLYTAFGSILLFGLATGRHWLKLLMEAAFPPLTDRGWHVLTRNWALFFLVLAALNEVVWRSTTTDQWVFFKTWLTLPITLVFAISQMPVMNRHMLPETDNSAPADEDNA